MILRFARHGQPALDGMPPGANHELPPGDFPLSALGRKQALFLGRHLQSVGFRGTIIASPYARTAETASIAASVCGNVFYPEPRLQEMRFYPVPPCPGMTLEELRRNYENLAPDAALTFPWLTPGGVEELDTVRRRVDAYVAELIRNPPAEDILLIGHGATIQSLKWNMFRRAGYTGRDRHNWNCSLSGFHLSPDGSAVMFELARFDFMPQECVTSNKRLYGDPACI